MDFFAFLRPIEIAVAWIMVQFHSLLTRFGMPEESGWTWALSIVGLVIVIRILLIPLFVKQINASRGLQLIQPEMKKIQAKYKGKTDPASRQAMTQETMELYKRTGTNPFASCLPILLQSPIFFALFRVLNTHVRSGEGIGPLTPELARQADVSTLLGAPLSATFLGSDDMSVKLLTVVLIVLMSVSTFTTQKQLMTKNMPAAALDNPFAQQQKILLYVLPLVFAVSGVNFPIGVLIYWLTTNVWSMGQQFYVIRRMPAPGSAAEKALQERRARKGKSVPGAMAPEADDVPVAEPVRGQRVQPKRKDRNRKAAAAGDNGKPTGGKAAGGKPTVAKPAGGKPTVAKPAGGKPAGGKPAGAKAPSTKPGTKTGGTQAPAKGSTGTAAHGATAAGPGDATGDAGRRRT